jgi:hypothetical protein
MNNALDAFTKEYISSATTGLFFPDQDQSYQFDNLSFDGYSKLFSPADILDWHEDEYLTKINMSAAALLTDFLKLFLHFHQNEIDLTIASKVKNCMDEFLPKSWGLCSRRAVLDYSWTAFLSRYGVRAKLSEYRRNFEEALRRVR